MLNLTSLRQIKELAAKEAKKTNYYRKLVKRNFTRHAGYTDYKSVAVDLATTLMCADTGVPMKAKEGHDPAYIGMLHSAWMAYERPTFPVYAIERDLAKAFQQTETPTHVCKMYKMFDFGLFLLPANLIRNPDGLFCEWVMVTHFLPGDYDRYSQGYEKFLADICPFPIDVSEGEHPNYHKLRWASMLGVEFTYANTLALPEDSSKPIEGDLIVRGEDPNRQRRAEAEFAAQVTNLVLQTLLYMQTPKQRDRLAFGDGNRAKPQTRGFDPHSAQEFIWIGNDYRQPQIRRSPQGGSHASPQTHWRTGHWRFIPTSRNSEETRPVWVRPTIVNG